MMTKREKIMLWVMLYTFVANWACLIATVFFGAFPWYGGVAFLLGGLVSTRWLMRTSRKLTDRWTAPAGQEQS
jgi:hypothetical protein